MVVLGLVFASCAARGGPGAALPDPPPVSLAGTEPALVPGEQTTWQVFWKTLAIGRVDLVIDAHQARTQFRTGALASALASVRYELTTTLDHGRVIAATDTLTVDGKPSHSEVAIDRASFTVAPGGMRPTPGGGQLHTLHTALGVLRAWSKQKRAPAGYLWVVHQGQLFRVDVFRPTREDVLGIRALRIEGVVRALDGSPALDLTLWLAANRDRTPLRFAISGGGTAVSAEVAESTASFD